MNEQQTLVQKYIVTFCKSLSNHVQKWESLIQDSTKPLTFLANLTEQKRQVDSAKFKYLETFESSQKILQFEITNRIEEELSRLKDIIDKLNKSSIDLKNKLITLERSTLSLDWDSENNDVIKGNARQPSLCRLLQDGLEFVQFFSTSAKLINERFKSLNFANGKTLEMLKDSFRVDLRCKVVVNYLALTQYVDPDKKIV